LASHDDAAVLGRQGGILFATFHPELSGDLRLHELFLKGT
jgi:5'-phosphate synthase pdxT subunit